LKFFDESKNFGLIIMDADESDIFVHCDDLQKAGISKEKVKSYKQSEGVIRFSFKVMSYFGKYRESRKAVDLIILDDEHGMSSLYT
jgi:cold shock CspA family protein